MSRRSLDPWRDVESCTFQLNCWRPFKLSNTSKTLDSEVRSSSKPYPASSEVRNKRLCRSDRSFCVDAIDMSKLSLVDDDRPMLPHKRKNLLRIAPKRRRHGPRSLSGLSSDRSATRRRCCSVGTSAANATCSDFPVALVTDSSGELFFNGDVNWVPDVSESTKNLRRNRDGGNGDRENTSSLCGQLGNSDSLGNESGYGSEPGYRGDAEFGYGDEVDEEEDDPRPLFWGDSVGDPNTEVVGENTMQKAHHRCRRKKQDLRMADPHCGR